MATRTEISQAIASVSRALRKAREAAFHGNHVALYGALEEAQHAAFDAKELVGSKLATAWRERRE